MPKQRECTKPKNFLKLPKIALMDDTKTYARNKLPKIAKNCFNGQHNKKIRAKQTF
jgi:hypothetical protein